MAENAVFISSLEHIKPTIFELIAQESLMRTLQPSFSLLCKVFKTNFPTKFQWLFKFEEECYTLLNFLLQYHYISHFNGSFSEVFYGLKRVSIKNKLKRLSKYSKILSLITLVAFPYLSIKMKRMIESYQLKLAVNNATDNDKKRINQIMYTFKSLNTVYEAAKLYYLISYMSGYTKFHSPLLRLANVKLVYHNVEVPSWTDIITEYFKNKNKISKIILPITFKFFSQFLEVTAFTIQFLNWWHSDEVKTKLNSLPVPSPLPIRVNERTVCPICNEKRKVEVVLKCSGYVYCYRCIKDELDRTGKCPVTNIPATADQLIRIYADK